LIHATDFTTDCQFWRSLSNSCRKWAITAISRLQRLSQVLPDHINFTLSTAIDPESAPVAVRALREVLKERFSLAAAEAHSADDWPRQEVKASRSQRPAAQ